MIMIVIFLKKEKEKEKKRKRKRKRKRKEKKRKPDSFPFRKGVFLRRFCVNLDSLYHNFFGGSFSRQGGIVSKAKRAFRQKHC